MQKFRIVREAGKGTAKTMILLFKNWDTFSSVETSQQQDHKFINFASLLSFSFSPVVSDGEVSLSIYRNRPDERCHHLKDLGRRRRILHFDDRFLDLTFYPVSLITNNLHSSLSSSSQQPWGGGGPALTSGSKDLPAST